jgi:hypothetical protein
MHSGSGRLEGPFEGRVARERSGMPADSNPSLTLHEVLVEARCQLDGDGPSYQWGHARIMSGELPATKVGPVWKLPPSAVGILKRLWRARRRRSSCAA